MPLTDEVVAEIDGAVEQEMSASDSGETNSKESGSEESDLKGSDSEEDSKKDNSEEGSSGESSSEEGSADSGFEEGSEEGSADSDSKEKPISDYALTKAVIAGLPLEDARQFPSEESLLRSVAHLEAIEQEQSRAQGQETTSLKESEQDEDIFAGLPKLDPKTYEPDVIQMFDALKGVISKQQEAINEFKTQQQTTMLVSQQAAAREVEQWFDAQIKGLGDEFSEALGTGGYGTLVPGSSQFAKRDAIAQQMAVTLAGYQATGLQAPPREQVFDAAVRVVLQDDFAQRHGKELANALKKRQSQHISRASGQKGKSSQTPDEETAALLDAKYPK